MGFGEYRPLESNLTARGRQKNRRVEIILSNLPEHTAKREAEQQSILNRNNRNTQVQSNKPG